MIILKSKTLSLSSSLFIESKSSKYKSEIDESVFSILFVIYKPLLLINLFFSFSFYYYSYDKSFSKSIRTLYVGLSEFLIDDDDDYYYKFDFWILSWDWDSKLFSSWTMDYS